MRMQGCQTPAVHSSVVLHQNPWGLGTAGALSWRTDCKNNFQADVELVWDLLLQLDVHR